MAAARVNIICKNFVCFRNRGWGPGKGEGRRRFAMSLWSVTERETAGLRTEGCIFKKRPTIVWGFNLSRVSSWGLARGVCSIEVQCL